MKEKCRYGKSLKLKVSGLKFRGLVACGLWLMACGLWLGCEEKKQEQKTELNNPDSEIYTCPMHPEIVQDHPGICPKPECHGMALVLKTEDTLIAPVIKHVNSSVLASIKTVKPVYAIMPVVVEADGYIDYNENMKNNIASLVGGRIEKLYVRYNYQPVKKGQRVLDLYSPELITAQENLVYLLNNDSMEQSLINAAKQKLALLDFKGELLNELIRTKKVKQTIPIYSNYNGYVYEKSATSAMNPMAAAQTENTGTGKQLTVKEGKYVMMSETIFYVANNENIAVMFQVKSEDVSKVQKGAEANIINEGNRELKGKVDFIEPILKEGRKTMTGRIYLHNTDDDFKVGSLVKVKIKGEVYETLWVPASAVMDMGKGKFVWLKKNGNFTAKIVETGLRSGDRIEIADGLTEADEIAIEAHYLIDSEGFVKENENEE